MSTISSGGTRSGNGTQWGHDVPPEARDFLSDEAFEALAGFDRWLEQERDRDPAGPRFSDLVDGEGRQYADVVMEGGGVLGIALLGSLFVMERAGLRFRSIGGTSAGAITAALLAGIAPPGEPKTVDILRIVAGTDFFSFVDGGRDAESLTKKLVAAAVRGKFALGPLLIPIMQNLDELLGDEGGANPGRAFEAWLEQHLAAAGVRTTADLVARMRAFPEGMSHISERGAIPQSTEALDPRLRLVTCELATRSKLVFPEMAGLLFSDPMAVNPARYVRCSMSVPYFFEPVRLRPPPGSVEAWRKHVGWTGEPPKEAVLVDGGVISNFPVSLFHGDQRRPPRCPTLGIKLGVSRNTADDVKGPFGLFGAMFSTARQASDLDFLWRNPDHQRLVHAIDTDPVHWLNFDLKREDQRHLFSRGVICGCRFLREFNWPAYKALRAAIPATVQQRRAMAGDAALGQTVVTPA